ncbi:MAG: DUF192 domain-containing protein [Siculibacillus sp.]
MSTPALVRTAAAPARAGLVRAAALALAVIAALVLGLADARAEGSIMRTGTLDVVTASGAVTTFRIEIADDAAARAQGLMYRKELAPDYGMLFDFRREEPVWFWMKNTFVSLDMIFARADGTIVNVAPDTTPLSEATVASAGPVRFVFEVVAGTAARIGLKPGDRLVHPRMRPAK